MTALKHPPANSASSIRRLSFIARIDGMLPTWHAGGAHHMRWAIGMKGCGMNGAQYALAALVGERPDAAERRRSQRRQVALTVLIGVLSLVLCGSISGGSISANPAGRGR
jgi:hypothetical protein